MDKTVVDKVAVRIVYDGSEGSGVLLSTIDKTYTYIITAFHVLKETDEPDLNKIFIYQTAEGTEKKIHLVLKRFEFDKDNDLAVLQAEYINDIPMLTISPSLIEEKLLLVGYPEILLEEKNKRLSLNTVYSEKRGKSKLLCKITDNLSNYSISEIDHLNGFSGGGLFSCYDNDSYLIGIETNALTNQANYYAIEGVLSDYIIDFIYKKFYNSDEVKISELFLIKSELYREIKMSSQYKDTVYLMADFHTSKTDSELKTEYESGVNAQPDHIRRNFDIKREKLLNEINTKFIDNNIVIIRGSSGQGKTTIAYRYLMDNYREENIVCICNLRNHTQVAEITKLIMSSHKFYDLIFYIDVSSENTEWVSLCEQFNILGIKSKLLVTVREEDYNRSTISDNIFIYKEICLDFSLKEAEKIYRIYQPEHFRTFEESWKAFGEKGPLMEYIYLLNHSETLKNRIKGQIKNIVNEDGTDDWIDALAIISLAGKYSNSINQTKLFSTINVNNRNKMINRLQKEFFIRNIGNGYIECLHALRADILFEVILEECCIDYNDTLFKTLSIIEENALYMLVEYFSKNNINETWINDVSAIQFQNVKIFADVLWAILWCEIKNYIKINKAIIDEGNSLTNNSFCLVAIVDITGLLVFDKDPLETLKIINPKMVQSLKKVVNKLTKRYLDYSFVDIYLNNSKLQIVNFINKERTNWLSIGFVLFWMACRGVMISESDINDNIILRMDPDNVDDCLNLYLGVYKQQWLKIAPKMKEKLLPIILSQLNVIYYEERNNQIFSYILPKTLKSTEHKNTNDILVNAVYIFKALNPTADKYNIKIIGMDYIELDIPYVEKNIPNSNAPYTWLTKLNNIFLKLDEYSCLPEDWNQLLNELLSYRKLVVDFLEEVSKLITYYYKQNKRYIPDNLKKYDTEIKKVLIKSPFVIPKCAKDQYGLSKGNGSRYFERYKAFELAHNTEDSFSKICNNYFKAISNFGNWYALFINEILENKCEKGSRLACYNIIDAFNKLNDFQIQFKAYFARFDYKYNDKRETEVIERIAALCKYIYVNPYRPMKDVVFVAYSYAKSIKAKIKNFFSKDYKKIAGVIDGEFKEKTLFLNVDFYSFTDCLDELYDKIITLTDDMTVSTLESAYLKQIAEKIVINVLLQDDTLISGYTIETENYITFSKNKDKFKVVDFSVNDAKLNEKICSTAQAAFVLQSTIHEINQIFRFAKCIYKNLEDVPQCNICLESVDALDSELTQCMENVIKKIKRSIDYISGHLTSKIELDIIAEAERLKIHWKEIISTIIFDKIYDSTQELSALITKFIINLA